MSFKLAALTLFALVAVAASGYIPLDHYITKRAVLLDENFDPANPVIRVRRDLTYGEPHNDGYKHRPKGKVGQVFTFAKTDYNGNFKWGVRHSVGPYAG